MKSKKGSYRDPVPEIGTHWDSADWGILEVLLTHFTEKTETPQQPPFWQQRKAHKIDFQQQSNYNVKNLKLVPIFLICYIYSSFYNNNGKNQANCS